MRTAPKGVEPLAEGFTASEEEFALGRALFFDLMLSGRGTIACASCHRPEFAFADKPRDSRGIEGYPTRRNAPAIFNKGLSENLLRTAAPSTLEEQVVMPIENPEEMALGVAAAVNRLGFDEEYDRRFREVYGREVNGEDLAKALAAFVRGLTVGDSPVDRFRLGSARRSRRTRRRGSGSTRARAAAGSATTARTSRTRTSTTRASAPWTGSPLAAAFKITVDESDRGRFRTPGLRMLAKTAPYMHDGSIETLEEVVEFYSARRERQLEPLRSHARTAAHGREKPASSWPS